MARVRIKDHDRRTGLSIAVVVGAAVVVWFAWMLWSRSPAGAAVQRSPDQVAMRFGCDAGHYFEARGATRSRPCRAESCQHRAWPLWTLQCTKDGAFVMQLRYEVVDGRTRIRKVRHRDGDWREVTDDIPCPRCERALLPDLSFRRTLLVDGQLVE